MSVIIMPISAIYAAINGMLIDRIVRVSWRRVGIELLVANAGSAGVLPPSLSCRMIIAAASSHIMVLCGPGICYGATQAT